MRWNDVLSRSRGRESALTFPRRSLRRLTPAATRSLGGSKFCDVEHGLDGAALLAAADERAVGAFAQDEVERADDDGFSRAGFAGDGIAAGLEFQREVGDQGEVFDAQCR